MEYNCQGSLKVYIWSAPNIWSAPTVSVHAVTPPRFAAGSLHSISSPEKYLFMSLRSRHSGRAIPQAVIARSVATWQSLSQSLLSLLLANNSSSTYHWFRSCGISCRNDPAVAGGQSQSRKIHKPPPSLPVQNSDQFCHWPLLLDLCRITLHFYCNILVNILYS